jgi:Tfp pilus assembly protein PilN
VAIRINLLPRDARAVRRGRAVAVTPRAVLGGPGFLARLLTGLFVLTLLTMGALGYRAFSAKQAYQTQIADLKAQTDQLRMQLSELDQAEKAKIEIQRRIEVIGKVAKSQGVPLAMLNGVLRAVPDGVWLYGVEMRPQEVQVRVDETQAAQTSGTLGQAHRGRVPGAAAAAGPAAGRARGRAAGGLLRGDQGRRVQQFPDR